MTTEHLKILFGLTVKDFPFGRHTSYFQLHYWLTDPTLATNLEQRVSLGFFGAPALCLGSPNFLIYIKQILCKKKFQVSQRKMFGEGKMWYKIYDQTKKIDWWCHVVEINKNFQLLSRRASMISQGRPMSIHYIFIS